MWGSGDPNLDDGGTKKNRETQAQDWGTRAVGWRWRTRTRAGASRNNRNPGLRLAFGNWQGAGGVEVWDQGTRDKDSGLWIGETYG